MLNFFFGWLIKGQMNVSFLDTIVAVLEFVAVFFIVIFVGFIIEKFKNNRNK